MRRWTLVAVVLMTLVAGLSAQHTTRFEQVTVAGTAIGITSTVTDGMLACAVRLETAEVRWRIDASPTASVGTLLEVGDVLRFDRIEEAQAVKFIRTTGTSGLLNVWCWSRSRP